MLIGIYLKIHIVQQAAQAPEFNILALFLGIPAHYAFYCKRVQDMEGLLIVFFEKLQRFCTGEFHMVSSCLFFYHFTPYQKNVNGRIGISSRFRWKSSQSYGMVKKEGCIWQPCLIICNGAGI